MNEASIDAMVLALAQQARAAALRLASAKSSQKDQCLRDLASIIEQSHDFLLEANAKDLAAGKAAGLSAVLLDRLRLSQDRLTQIAEGVLTVAELPDPVGTVIEEVNRPNGLKIQKVRVPIGVIGIIYESRPNVTIDCAALCLKSGNAAILRGGKEAFHTNTALSSLIREVLGKSNLPNEAVQLVPTAERTALSSLLRQDEYVHCIIPRGGEGLIRFVAENALMPVIKHYKGVCCLTIDEAADPEMSESIVVNAKCQRPGVCNAIENLWVHQAVAAKLLPRIAKSLGAKDVELRLDKASIAILGSQLEQLKWQAATEEDYHEEYLDLILAVKVVPDLESAIAATNTYGSAHSDGIVTSNEDVAQRFMASVDSATVYWNASTRFTDGFEFGLGAEIGISTDKLHARGPMGLSELCTYKYCITGKGQIR